MGIEVILYLQSLRSPTLDSIMLGISALGSVYAYIVMLPLIYWILGRRRGWLLALVFLLSMQVNGSLKEFTETLRPFQVDGSVELIGPKPHTYAFPSGHAQGSLMIWGGLAAMHPTRVPVTIYASIIFLVGLARLYLGVHWPFDVAAGWILGGLSLAVMFILFKLDETSAEEIGNCRVRLFWVIGGCGMIILCPSQETVAAGATLAAVAVLEYWEKKWIGFDDCRQALHRIARLAAGFLPPSALLPFYRYPAYETLWVRGIVFALMGGWMVLGAPYLFKRLRI